MTIVLLFLRPAFVTPLVRGMVLLSSAVFFLAGCTEKNPVKEYFEDHGRSYPVEVTELSLWSLKYSGVVQDELMTSEAREYVEEGLLSIKEYFRKKEFGENVSYVDAIIVSSPVLYREKGEEVGLMVKVTAFGSGKPDRDMTLPVEWVGKNERLWKVVNFAYFNRRGLDAWQHGGWVY